MSSEKYLMEAKTFEGLESVLKEELISIGASDVEVVEKGVKFSGSLEILYKANFCCRTALRILVTIKEFGVKNSSDLYNGVRSIEWTDFFEVQQSFSVTSTVHSEALNNSMFVSLKTKDAIIDQFKSKLNKRPSVNTENPDIRVVVHASVDVVTVSLDSSGESLTKRGYRPGQSEGSMSEVLAAGILKIAGWKGQCDLYDPICGLGIIPIEAALIARNIPPGIFRKSFAFEKWKNFNADLFDGVYNADYEKSFEHTIYASDVSPGNVRISTENARNAGLKKDIQFSLSDFSKLKPTKDSGLLIVNPPHVQRANDRLVDSMYKMIGDSLKINFKGIKAWVFSNSEEGLRSIGLKPSSIIKLYNGTIECELRNYEMYDGSRSFSKPDFNQRPSNDRYRDNNNFSGPRRTDAPGDRRPRSFGAKSTDGRPTQPRRDDPKSATGGTYQNRRRSDSPSRSNDGPKRTFRKPDR